MVKTAQSIVLTGAPGSGKTEILEYLKGLEPLKRFVFFDELARKLIAANPEYRKNWHQLHLDIYSRQVARESEIAAQPFITDRGTADAFAFHPETIAAVNTTINKEHRRYGLVIQLGSSAILGEEFYKTDLIRNEPIKEALRIEKMIKQVWQDHPNYHFIKAEPKIESKRQKVVALIGHFLDLELIA